MVIRLATNLARTTTTRTNADCLADLEVQDELLYGPLIFQGEKKKERGIRHRFSG